MKNFFKNIQGMILAESLLSVVTLTSGVICAGIIINMATSTTILSKDYLIAQNLELEGVEVLKGMVLTNWMNFPDDRTCWLTVDRSNCNQKMQSEEAYIVKYEENDWKFQQDNTCGGSDLTTQDSCNLALVTKKSGNGSSFQRYLSYDKQVAPDKSRYYRALKAVEVTDDQALFEVRMQWKDGVKLREIKEFIRMYNYL